MRTIKYSVSYEKLISRLPAMFPFINTDEQGVTRIVKATEGEQGDYGKIVANIECPEFIYDCQDGSRIYISEGMQSYRTIIDSYYRALKDIKEQLSSDWNERVETAIRKCETIPNFNEELNREKEKYEFIVFVDKGIGLKYVGLSEKDSDREKCGAIVKEKFPLAPDYIYLGEAKTFYNRVVKIKKQLDFLNKHLTLCKDDIRFRDELQHEYDMMRGDELLILLRELIKESDGVAELYLNKAEQWEVIKSFEYEGKVYKPHTTISNEKYEKLGTNQTNCKPIEQECIGPKINFDVNLINNIKDLGMVTPYIQEWIPGKYYYDGDVVYYIDQYGYGMTWVCDIKDVKADTEDTSEEDKTYVYKDEFNRKYINGQYDEETELISFENGTQTVYDGKKIRNYWKPQSLNWVVKNQRYVCEKCGKEYQGDESPISCSCGNDSFKVLKYVTNAEKINTIEGECNSHLHSLRRYEEYINSEDQIETPDAYRDWLWYYRLGTIVNREGLNDENGNMTILYGETNGDSFYANGIKAITNVEDIVEDETTGTVQNLAIWGDVLTNITCENKYETKGIGIINFEYWLGAHLIAKKGKLIEVVEEDCFSGNSTIKEHKVGEDVREIYNNLKEDDKNKVSFIFKETHFIEETFVRGEVFGRDKYEALLDDYKNNFYIVVKNAFTENGVQYNVNRIISRTIYDGLSETNKNKLYFKVNQQFINKGHLYNNGDIIEAYVYKTFTDNYTSNLEFKVKRAFKNDGIYYKEGDVIDSTLYNSLTVSRKDNIDIVAVNTFNVGGTLYKGGDTIRRSMYEALNDDDKLKVKVNVDIAFTENVKSYKKDEKITHLDYTSLSDENKNKVNFVVENEFVIGGINYYHGNYITKEDYFGLTEGLKGNIEFVVNRNFTYNFKKYVKGETFSKKDYDEKTLKHDKDKISFIIVADFNSEGTVYEVGKIITRTDFDALTNENKQNISLIMKENCIEETREYRVGDTLTTEEYESLSDANKEKCKIDENSWYSVDDDGNYKYYFKEFEADVDMYDKFGNQVKYASKYGANHGVKYTESYIYSKSEDDDSIWKLVESGKFQSYIEGKFDRESKFVTTENEYKTREKFEFITSNNIGVYELRVGSYLKEVPYIKTKFTTNIDIQHVDVEKTPLIRYDYYNGVSFQPSVNKDVYVERGVTQAFEKHIKFSEIKTFEDLENYSNGGFFVVSKENIDLG